MRVELYEIGALKRAAEKGRGILNANRQGRCIGNANEEIDIFARAIAADHGRLQNHPIGPGFFGVLNLTDLFGDG